MHPSTMIPFACSKYSAAKYAGISGYGPQHANSAEQAAQQTEYHLSDSFLSHVLSYLSAVRLSQHAAVMDKRIRL